MKIPLLRACSEVSKQIDNSSREFQIKRQKYMGWDQASPVTPTGLDCSITSDNNGTLHPSTL
jgi:hypothetical protein